MKQLEKEDASITFSSLLREGFDSCCLTCFHGNELVVYNYDQVDQIAQTAPTGPKAPPAPQPPPRKPGESYDAYRERLDEWRADEARRQKEDKARADAEAAIAERELLGRPGDEGGGAPGRWYWQEDAFTVGRHEATEVPQPAATLLRPSHPSARAHPHA